MFFPYTASTWAFVKQFKDVSYVVSMAIRGVDYAHLAIIFWDGALVVLSTVDGSVIVSFTIENAQPNYGYSMIYPTNDLFLAMVVQGA